MKKIFAVAAFALFGLMNAQTEKGSWVIGGSTNLGFNSVTTKYSVENESETSPATNTFSFTPTVGYFVMDNLAVGIDLGLLNVSTKDDDYKETSNTFSVMPTGTYYFKATPSLRPYVGAGVGYATTKYTEKFANISESEDYDGLAWKAKGGFVYLLNQNIGIDLGLGYSQFTNKETVSDIDYKTTAGTFGVNVGFSLFLK